MGGLGRDATHNSQICERWRRSPPREPGYPPRVHLLLLACSDPVTCGPGTSEAEGACLPVAVDAPDTEETRLDSGEADTGSSDPPILDVYLLAGQSNMDGYAYVTGLPPEWQVADPRAPLYWSGWGEFRELQPASYGGGYLAGPEVSFGRTLADDGHHIALVKHAVGGTDLAYYWYPGATPGDFTAGDGFKVFLQSMDYAAAELDASGEAWRWAGFVWMQGESDSLDIGMAHDYEANLQRLIAAVREVTAQPALPVAVGLIARESLWTYADLVRDAQTAVAVADVAVVTVETDDLPRNPLDLAHYDGSSNRALGIRFANALERMVDIPAGADAPTPLLSVSTWRTDYDFTGTCGYGFTVNRTITITDVGNFAPGSYVYTSADVGLWDSAGNLVLRANVPGWYDAPAWPRASFAYAAIDPVEVQAGEYRLGIVSWAGDSDRYANDADATFAEGFAYAEAVYAEGYWLTYPVNIATTSGVSFVGPNLLWREP